MSARSAALAEQAQAALGELLAGAPARVQGGLLATLKGLYRDRQGISSRDLDIELLGSVYASLQSTAERRCNGAHYTPRSLTAPIVATTLEPILGACPLPAQILDIKIVDPAMGSGAFLIETCRYLASALVQAWHAHGGVPPLSQGEDPVVHARRLVAQRCLYGVDKDPLAVELARLSLWLFTMATNDRPFAFLDHALRHGDALVGLSTEQILGKAAGSPLGARLAGDLMIADFFEERVAALLAGEHPVPPFHWEIELPEVFARPNPGFDAVVGNPPFAGKNTLAATTRRGYLDWLKALHPGSHGNADLVAHFFRRAFCLLRQGGTFGLVATNTIAQGDTRSTGLRHICEHGGSIYAATKRVRWPDPSAAVVVSVVHVRRGPSPTATLDGRSVERVSAYLFDKGGDSDPLPLSANHGKCFQGPIALGMGFTLSLAEVARLGRKDSRNLAKIFPYLGGDELLKSPTQAPHRFIIHFGDMSLAEASAYPDLMQIVEEKVRPARLLQKDRGAKERWWQFIRPRPELGRALSGLVRVLMHPFLSSHMAFAFVPAETVVAGPCNVFPLGSYAAFAMLQSRVHEVWVRFFSSSLKDDLRYTPTRCFLTFPFPIPLDLPQDPALEAAGEAYYKHRAALMLQNNEGLTATYRRFHDPEERAPGIEELRALHAEMDRQVLSAYGWKDIPTACRFLLEYEDDDGGRRRKKPFRYRFPEEVTGEVLARLIALNQARAARELRLSR